MRLLPLLVAGLAMTTSTVSAQCTGVGTGTPTANALVFFLSSYTSKGNFGNTALASSTPGLAGGDNLCNNDAKATSTPARTTRVKAAKGLFRAVLSNQLVNAKDRFIAGPTTPNGLSAVDPTWDVVDSNGNCLASSVASLFSCTHMSDFNAVFLDSRGNTFTANSLVKAYTGSTCDGQRWHMTAGAGGNPLTDATLIQQAYCSVVSNGTPDPTDVGWNNDGSCGTCSNVFSHVGQTYETTVGGSDWIEFGQDSCSNGYRVYCLQASQPATAAPTSGGHGDPQFTGLQGQQFQVHGMPDEFFNLITTPDMQLNSRFAYLASGTCNYNNTDCWTHPGTYVDQLGFMFPELRIKAVAGSHDKGMIVHINDARMEVTEQPMEHTIGVHAGSYTHNTTQSQTVRVSLNKHDVLVVETDMFTVTATNSDMFFNFGVEMHSRDLLTAGSPVHHLHDPSDARHKYPAYPIHGLLGQTWQNARYQHGQLYAGSADDYMLLDSKLFSAKFVFNQYQH